MNELGIIVDLSHCGRKTSMDGIEVSGRPPAFTHTFCEAIYNDHPRAKTDEQIRAMSDKGGVTGIATLGYFVGPDPDTSLEDYVDHVVHAVNVGGIEHVGVCTDHAIRGLRSWATRENWYEPRLRNFKPSYRVRWPPFIEGLDEPERFRNVAHALDPPRRLRGGHHPHPGRQLAPLLPGHPWGVAGSAGLQTGTRWPQASGTARR